MNRVLIALQQELEQIVVLAQKIIVLVIQVQIQHMIQTG